MALKPEFKKTLYSFPIIIEEFKSVGDDWEVSGYPSTFNNRDLGDDIMLPGAFKRTLVSGPKVRYLRDHDTRLLLGVPLKLNEDGQKGLFGRFKISKTKLGEETHQLIVDGALDSFSIGYHADDYEIDEKEHIRYLKQVTLYEVSQVAMPMNEDAIVTGFKDLFGFPGMTLADQAGAYAEGMNKLLNDLRDLVKNIDRPLSETKRQELTRLLESCSGLDAVRTDLQSVLSSAPTGLVSAKRTSYDLAQARKRLAHILLQE